MKGVVLIGFPLTKCTGDPILSGPVKKIYSVFAQKVVPVRLAAVHLCIADNPWFRLASTLLLQAFSKEFRLRSRVHIGEIPQAVYSSNSLNWYRKKCLLDSTLCNIWANRSVWILEHRLIHLRPETHFRMNRDSMKVLSKNVHAN